MNFSRRLNNLTIVQILKNVTRCQNGEHLHDKRFGCGECGEKSWVCTSCKNHMTHGINGGDWRFYRDSNGLQCYHIECFGNTKDQEKMYLEDVFDGQVPARLYDLLSYDSAGCS